jgi:hypothetical protein
MTFWQLVDKHWQGDLDVLVWILSLYAAMIGTVLLDRMGRGR